MDLKNRKTEGYEEWAQYRGARAPMMNLMSQSYSAVLARLAIGPVIVESEAMMQSFKKFEPLFNQTTYRYGSKARFRNEI